MRDQTYIESLKAELADKKAQLADVDSGQISLGGPFEENREAGIWRRITEIELQLRKRDADQT